MESTDDRYQRLKRTVRRLPIAAPATAAPAAAQGRQRCKSKGAAGELRTTDDHGIWKEARQDPQRAKAAIEQAVRDAVFEVGRDKIPDCLLKAAALEELGRGDTPGDDVIGLAGGNQAQLDWRQLLHRYVSQLLRVRPVFNRPPRRFPELVGIVPGRRRQADRRES
jgi:hypothetical protein